MHSRGSKRSSRRKDETLENALRRGRFPLPSKTTACVREMQLLVARQHAVAIQLEQLMIDSSKNAHSSDSGEEKSVTSFSYRMSRKPASRNNSSRIAIPEDSGSQFMSVSGDEDLLIRGKVGTNRSGLSEIVQVLRQNTADRMQAMVMNLNDDLKTEEDDFNEESTPLVVALKKLQQKNIKQTGIKMWTNSLAELFFITDVDGSGTIEPDEYREMVEKLQVSKTMKNALWDKFDEIDTNKNGSVSLYEFLYFFLRYPKFNEELLVNAHNNSPYILEKDLSWCQLLRLNVYLLVECPNMNMLSKSLFCFDLLVTSVPLIMLCVQAITPSSVIVWGETQYMWGASIFFAIEWVLGLLTCRDRWKFISNMWHCIELVSFIFWIIYNLVLPEREYLDPTGFIVFRILRVVKIHNVFKWESFKENLGIYTDTLQLAYTSYGAVLGFLSMLMMFFALLFYAFERGSFEDGVWIRDGEDEESPFSSFVNCVYFTIVTFTTLGYGDIAPKSIVGKLVAVIAVVAGLCNLTFLINIIGDCFEEVFRVFVQRRSMKMEEERSNFIEKQIKRAKKHVTDMRSRTRKRTLKGHMEMMFKSGEMSKTPIGERVSIISTEASTDGEDPRANVI